MSKFLLITTRSEISKSNKVLLSPHDRQEVMFLDDFNTAFSELLNACRGAVGYECTLQSVIDDLDSKRFSITPNTEAALRYEVEMLKDFFENGIVPDPYIRPACNPTFDGRQTLYNIPWYFLRHGRSVHFKQYRGFMLGDDELNLKSAFSTNIPYGKKDENKEYFLSVWNSLTCEEDDNDVESYYCVRLIPLTRTFDYKKHHLQIDVKDVTLLSRDEVQDVGKYIIKYNPLEPYCFYLRTPGPDNTIATGCLRENGSVFDDYVEPDYLSEWDFQGVNGGIIAQGFGTGLKPILHIGGEVANFKTILRPEDKVIIGNETFTYVTNNILVLDRYIPGDYISYYHIFDNNTNNYNNSEAKAIVDAWFEKEIKPYL